MLAQMTSARRVWSQQSRCESGSDGHGGRRAVDRQGGPGQNPTAGKSQPGQVTAARTGTLCVGGARGGSRGHGHGQVTGHKIQDKPPTLATAPLSVSSVRACPEQKATFHR